MSSRRITIAAAVLLAFLPALPVILGGCESKPSEPVFDNIFDPEGPLLGDPLNVHAALGDTAINVTWDQPQGFGIALYEVSHSNGYGAIYDFFRTAEHTTAPFGSIIYPNPEPTMDHYFRVTAKTIEEDFIVISYQTPGNVVTPPRVIVGDGSGSTPTRNLTLSVTVSSGDNLLVADNEEFSGGLQFPVTEPGSAQDIPWDLGAADSNGVRKEIFVKALGDEGESAVFAGTVEIDFQPAFTILGAPATVASRRVELAIPSEGVLQMRFANTAGSLVDSPWLEGAAVLPEFELLDTLNPQVVYAEFAGDFGFISPVMKTSVAGNPLTDAVFSVDPEGIAYDPVVNLRCSALATLMRFTEGPDFTGVPWHDYAEDFAFVLSPGAGRKTIFGQFRNDFTDSPILAASVDYIESPLAVGFLAPAGGEILTGGVFLEIHGWALAASGGAAVDSVKIDTGDGAGFIRSEGLEDWSLAWTVPVVVAETPLVLRARAWATADSATTQISVSVIP